jgi:bifunctional UDP-N-acetylglucosamine pyrophosphorylase / glucosamine-1-phosphate N-acetyltransferase
MDLDIVILAAGKGTRMKSNLPKVMHQFLKKPFLQMVLETAKELKPNRIIPVIGYKSEIIREHFKELDLEFVEQKEQLGTGHAVQQAISKINSKLTMILYGDVPCINKDDLINLYKKSEKTQLALITFKKSNPKGFGRIVRDNNQKIAKIVEEKDSNDAEKEINEINTGIMCVETALLKNLLSSVTNDNAQKEYYLTDIIKLAVDAKINVDNIEAKNEYTIQGVNSIEELVQLERDVMIEKAKKLLEEGVKISDCSRIDIRGELVCEENVSIDIGCIFEGKVTLKKGSVIGPYNIIKDTNIGSGTELLAFNHVDNSIIGNDCRVGPYSRIRPQTQLNNKINIGNFVELKNVKVGEETKVNHLSYVGDSIIGKSVNVGAGTITCNYDGANKHQTIIEDGVFIGSDSQLIAPVTIKKGSTIGAGSTITQDTIEGKLTLSRVNQITVDSWERPKKK